MKRLLVLLAIVLSGLPVQAQAGFDPQTNAALQAVLDAAVEAGDAGAVLWIDGPMGHFEGASGYADVDAGLTVQPGDSFRLGSLTKPFTSTVVLQLVEEGVLTLDDLLAKWVPETAATLPYGDEITLRQLLTHTSGIHDYEVPVTALLQDPETRLHQWQPEEIVAVIADDEADFAPGTAFSYSNTGYILLGMVIEAASGKSLAANYRERILEPLDLSMTYLSDFEAPVGDLVQGYSTVLGTAEYNASITASAGGLVSNGADVTTFIRSLMAGDLYRDTATLQTMLEPTDLLSMEDGAQYALGILELPTPVGTAYGHNGQIFGYFAWALYLPDLDVSLVTFVNGDESYVDLGSIIMTLAALDDTAA